MNKLISGWWVKIHLAAAARQYFLISELGLDIETTVSQSIGLRSSNWLFYTHRIYRVLLPIHPYLHIYILTLYIPQIGITQYESSSNFVLFRYLAIKDRIFDA